MMDDIEDFGFSFEESVDDGGDIIAELENEIANLEAQLKEQKEITRTIMKKVTVFANNLCRDPEKEVIRWPNRKDAITKWLSELNEIYKGEAKEEFKIEENQ